jgi:replication factor A1
VFDKNSEIVQVPDDLAILEQGYCFRTIQEIHGFDPLRAVDLIGVVLTVGDLTQIHIKGSGVQKDRRNITLIDETGKIQVSLWSRNATMKYTEGDVVAIRGARVSDYQGKSLNSGDEHSQVYVEQEG